MNFKIILQLSFFTFPNVMHLLLL